MTIQQSKAEDKIPLAYTGGLTGYPVDMSSLLASPGCTFGAHVSPPGYHPTTTAQHALAHWNQLLENNCESHRDIFLKEAQWLVEHEVRIGNGAGGWPI